MKQLEEKCKECYCSKCSQNDTLHNRKTKYGCRCRKNAHLSGKDSAHTQNISHCNGASAETMN